MARSLPVCPTLRWSCPGIRFGALAEADTSRSRHVIGAGLRSRTDCRRDTAIALAASVLSQTPELWRSEHTRLPRQPMPIDMFRSVAESCNKVDPSINARRNARSGR